MTSSTVSNAHSETHLRGWKLAAARTGWLVFFAAAVVTLLVALPQRWSELTEQFSVVRADPAVLGESGTALVAFAVASELIFIGVYLGVGLLIFLRRSDDPMALFTSLMLVAFGIGNQTITPTIGALRPQPGGTFIFATFGFAAWATFSTFWFLFPSGHFVPRWTRLAALIWLLLCIPWNYGVGTRFDIMNWPEAIFYPLILVMWATWPVSQVIRYRRVSTGIERQQTKWVVYALAMVAVGLAAFYAVGTAVDSNLPLYMMAGSGPATAWSMVVYFGWQTAMRLLFLLVPVAFALSILRYGLYDIDLVIRRTLQYGVLTLLLALVFFGAVTLLTSLLAAVTGQQSALALVIATLLIAALFNPLRRRIQNGIDRRFFRRKYDAQQVLARFAMTARNETDLDALTSELVRVVQETMEPATVSIWLRK